MGLIKKCSLLLIPFSFVYFLIISLRNFFYKRHIFKEYVLDARVISVGNITWGGTGKTPAVLFILKLLLKEKVNPAVLIRGYGNDEEALLSRLEPGVSVVVGKDRVKNGRDVIARRSVDTLLLDDGFQYRRLKRDLDIVCIDAVNPFGNGWMIPSGSMREGFSSLKRADIFLITKVDLAEGKNLQDLENKLGKINPGALVVKSVHRFQRFYELSDDKIVDIEHLKNKNIVLLSAIGNPRSFEKTVLKLGLKVKKHFVFRDHYWYSGKDLEKVNSFCAENEIDIVVTTEKDAVKLRPLGFRPQAFRLLVLSIKLDIIENEENFRNRLFGIYSS